MQFRGSTNMLLLLLIPLLLLPLLSLPLPRVEAGKNTSTVIPASRKRRRKGNAVVSDKTVMHRYEPSVTGHWQITLQITDPSSLQREHPKIKSKATVRQKKGIRKSWSLTLEGCPTPRWISLLTVGHNINSTLSLLILLLPILLLIIQHLNDG
jgi:hypothetical protein